MSDEDLHWVVFVVKRLGEDRLRHEEPSGPVGVGRVPPRGQWSAVHEDLPRRGAGARDMEQVTDAPALVLKVEGESVGVWRQHRVEDQVVVAVSYTHLRAHETRHD